MRMTVPSWLMGDVDGYADPRFSGAHCLNVT
jgi:hypothetical protein